MAQAHILRVDLNNRVATEAWRSLDDIKALGGKALAICLMEDLLDSDKDALDPANVVILTSSPLSRYMFPGSNRLGMFTRSPLTDGFLESYAGGSPGRALKEAGWDAVVVHGRTAEPVHVHLDEQGATLHSAKELWGRNVDEVDRAVRAKAGDKGSRLVIGPAGEALVRFASVQVDVHHALGRGGLGAVLGSKRVKAVTISSPGRVKPNTSERFDQVRRRVTDEATKSPVAEAYRLLGTPMMVAKLNEAGGFPALFWRAGTVEHRHRLEGEGFPEWADVHTESCPPCPMRCRKALTIKEGPRAGSTLHGPEYETLYAFGGLCMVTDAQDVLILNETCNSLGVDTISAGNQVALAVEAGRRGIAPEAPDYGDTEAIRRLLQETAYRSSKLGDLLAEGVRRAARTLRMAKEAIEIKGMEPAGYDPRALEGMGLAYATSPRGGCHLRTTFYKPILGGLTEGTAPRELAELFVDFEDRLFLHDCLIMCRFYRDFLDWETLETLASELNGSKVDREDLVALARDLLTRQRRLNFAMGVTEREDRLPRRFFEEALDTAPALDEKRFHETLEEYYGLRKWPGGIPS